jgi:hypothetical protein
MIVMVSSVQKSSKSQAATNAMQPANWNIADLRILR